MTPEYLKTKNGKPLNEAQQLMNGIYESGDSNKKQYWEDLETFYNTLLTALVTANSETINMLRIPGILSFIEDRVATKLAINGLDNDIKAFHKELDDIHKLHIGKVGMIITPEDLTNCFTIFEMYMAFQTRYHSVIMPTVEIIAEQCTAAAKRITESVKQTEEELVQDPTVVTDIAVKESPAEAMTIEEVAIKMIVSEQEQ